MRAAWSMHMLILCLVQAGCRQEAVIGGVPDSTFVWVMTELEQVQTDRSLDSAGRAAARQRILQRRGLTPEALERAARALADDPDRASEIWKAIDARIRASPSAGARP